MPEQTEPRPDHDLYERIWGSEPPVSPTAQHPLANETPMALKASKGEEAAPEFIGTYAEALKDLRRELSAVAARLDDLEAERQANQSALEGLSTRLEGVERAVQAISRQPWPGNSRGSMPGSQGELGLDHSGEGNPGI